MDDLKKADAVMSKDAMAAPDSTNTESHESEHLEDFIQSWEAKQLALLEQLEKRMENKRLKLIYELEDQLNITLPKS